MKKYVKPEMKNIQIQTDNKSVAKKKADNIFRNRYFVVIDVLIVIFSWFLAVLFINSIYDTIDKLISNSGAVIFSACAFLFAFYVFGVYRIMWALSGIHDYTRIIFACFCAAVVSVAFSLIFHTDFYFKYSIIAVIISSFFTIGSRLFVHGLQHLYAERLTDIGDKKRLMIIGAGSSAAVLIKDIANNVDLNYNPVCLIDDDPSKKNAITNGVKVVGTREDIEAAAINYDIDEIIIAMPSARVSDRRAIIEICNRTDCVVKIIPSLDKMISEQGLMGNLRNVKIEDLLERDPVILDNSKINQYIKDKVILVTGGGGSIGSELCRQIMKFNPKKLVVVDIYENNAYDLQMELNRKYPENKPEIVIASVRDAERLDDIFNKYRPYMVFHAAAHKHVPLMEDSPGEAIKNNVFGTLNVTRCSDKYGVHKFIMISTDKAVNPTNVMGATKRICEMIVQTAQNNSKTEFVCVRFGNVLGSNGSVIPLFKKQIEEGGPVTVTDKNITRFFMMIPEAAQLVLQAASYTKGGEIFVLDMGEPVKIYDLARNLIKLSGLRPGTDIKIVECGLRPGEKLYEELLMSEEGLTNTNHDKIFIGKPIDIKKEYLETLLDKLKEAAESDDTELIKDVIAEAVPTYVRNKTVE